MATKGTGRIITIAALLYAGFDLLQIARREPLHWAGIIGDLALMSLLVVMLINFETKGEWLSDNRYTRFVSWIFLVSVIITAPSPHIYVIAPLIALSFWWYPGKRK